MQGETVTFYCSDCQQRVFTTIREDGFICCEYCGFVPKPKDTTLSMNERWRRVEELLSDGSECSDYLEKLTNQYGDCIEQIHSSHMSRQEIRTFHQTFQEVWHSISDIGSYLMVSPEHRCSGVTDEKGLERKSHYKNKRGTKIHCYNFSQFKSSDMIDNMAYHYTENYGLQYYESDFHLNEFMKNIADPMERKIITLLYVGYRKSEIQKMLCLTESKLQTTIKHIENRLMDKPDLLCTSVKKCSRCKEFKLLSEFGRNDRSPDALQYVCRACERTRKHKNKINVGKSMETT